MKVLYVTVRPPYPPHKGDQVIAWEQIKQLKANHHSVFLVTIIKSQDEHELLMEKLNPYCQEIITFTLNPTLKLLRTFKTFFNFKPFQVNLYHDLLIKKLILEAYQRIHPDIIHVQTVRTAEYFIESEAPKCIDMIDALSLNMKRRAAKERLILKPILNLEYLLMKRYEKKVMENYDQTLLVSEKDKKYLCDDRIIVNPNGTFINKNHLKNYLPFRKEKVILFHGNMQYYPNVEAVYDFINDVWPDVHDLYPEYKFYVVGKDPVKKIRELHGKNNVVVTGFVDDICKYLTTAEIGVYPLKSGTGMQNKILEAMASGLPAIVSPLALHGISGNTGDELICAEHKEEVIEAIKLLIDNPDLRNRYGQKSQSFVQKNYSWERNYIKLLQAWEEAVLNKNCTQTTMHGELEAN